MSSSSTAHPGLRHLRNHLQSIYDSISHFQPPTKRPPILDSSLEVIQNPGESTHWLQHDNIPGLKKLKESIKVDLDALEKFIEDPASDSLPPLSTNAPYLIAVWNEILCARAPVICVFKSFSSDAEDAASTNDPKRAPAQSPRLQGTKVDVVADCGRHWIRVNTIKNSRILAEFREIDSYLTDDESSDEEDEDYRPSLAQKEFDNSVLRMGRSLVAAAKANPLQLPILNSEEISPRITLRLTRLDPAIEPSDPRITQTIQALIGMGIDVQLGERTEAEIPSVKPNTAPHHSTFVFEPTTRINLDLSVLIALVSDLTHSPLPATVEEANTRFIPPERYLEWKRKLNAAKAKGQKLVDPDFNDDDFELSLPAQQDMAKTSRALTNQVLQEMGKGLLQEMADRLNATEPNISLNQRKIEFWTTREARDRCLRIVAKVGGNKEKRRVQALLFDVQRPPAGASGLDADYPFSMPDTVEKAQELYWAGSRYLPRLLPLIPLHFFPASSPSPLLHPALSRTGAATTEPSADPLRAPFFRSLYTTCSDILEYEKQTRSRGGPRKLKGNFGLGPKSNYHPPDKANSPLHLDEDADADPGGESDPNTPSHPSNTISVSGFARATITKANPRLTAHTVQSLSWGASLGWTTLTANRTSVKAIVKEINARAKVEMYESFMHGTGSGDDDGVGRDTTTMEEGAFPIDVSATVAAQSAGPTSGPSSSSLTSSQNGDASHPSTHNVEAAIWLIDPRSLAEGMRADSED